MLLHRCPSATEKASGRVTEDVSDADGATIHIAHSMPKIVDPEIAEKTTWTLEYRVPFALFTNYFGCPAPRQGTNGAPTFTSAPMPLRIRIGAHGPR